MLNIHMPKSVAVGPEQEITQSLGELVKLERSRELWYWRGIAILVAISTIAPAVFTGLI
jgi:hypothetical protein